MISNSVFARCSWMNCRLFNCPHRRRGNKCHIRIPFPVKQGNRLITPEELQNIYPHIATFRTEKNGELFLRVTNGVS